MENEVLRDELATLERRFDEVQIINPYSTITVTRVSDHATESDISRLKSQIVNLESVVLSKDIDIEKIKSSESEYKHMVESLGQQLKTVQLNLGKNQAQAIQ